MGKVRGSRWGRSMDSSFELPKVVLKAVSVHLTLEEGHVNK